MNRGLTMFALFLLGMSGTAAAADGPNLVNWWGLNQGIAWFMRGGLVMYFILACSIIGLAVLLERLAFLRRKHLLPELFIRAITRAWQRREFEVAWRLCQQQDLPLSRILRAGLLKIKEGPQEVEHAIEISGSHEASMLEANIRFLGAIANIAPMLGFLGTVTGLITAFNVIAVQGTGDAKLMADGVSEALITTEFGLFVGIPALAAYHYLRGKVDRLLHEMEGITIDLLSSGTYSGWRRGEGSADDVSEEERGRL